MSLPDGSFLLIILWGFLIFILWNLYRFSETFRKITLVAIMGLATAALAGGIIYLHFHRQNAWREKRPGLLIFPAVEKSDSLAGGVINADGLAIAEITGEHLRRAPNPPFYLIPTETIFAAAQRDSLVYSDYVLRFARAAGLSMIGFCIYQKTVSPHVSLPVNFRIFDLREKNAPAEMRLKLPERFNSLPELAAETAHAILQAFAKNGAAATAAAWQNQVAPELLQRYYAAKFSLLLNQTESALQQARRLAQADTNQAQFAGLYVEAILAYLRRRSVPQSEWNDSLRVILPAAQRAAANDSLNSASGRGLGEIYIRLKKWSEAEKMLRLARRRDSTDSEIYLLLAQLHVSRLQAFGFQNELELYQHAAALNPLNITAALAAADYHWRENHEKQAAEILEHWLRLNPNHLEVLMSRARLYLAKNETPKILESYERILKLAPDHAEAYYNLGIAYYHQQDFDQAITFFERAIKLNDHVEARLYLASLYERRGDFDRAIRYLRERIIRSRSDDDKYAEAARKQLYKILLARGEIPAHLRPDSLK